MWRNALETLERMKWRNAESGPLHLATVLDACIKAFDQSPDADDRKAANFVVSKLVASLTDSVDWMLKQRQQLRNDSPEAQAKCQEMTKQIIAGMDALSRHTHPNAQKSLQNLFEQVVYQPVLQRLSLLSSATTAPIIHDPQLEELYGFLG